MAKKTSQSETNTITRGIPQLKLRSGRTYDDPRYVSAGKDRNGQPIAPQLQPSLTLPKVPSSIRVKNAEDIPLFYGLPQPKAPTRTGSNPDPRLDSILTGRDGQGKFGESMRKLQESEKFLAPTNLTGDPKTKPQYVVGTQARIAALKSASSSLRALNLKGPSERTAANQLQSNIKSNLELAQGQRNEVQSVLAEFRARQRAAIKTNQEVSSGRRPRRSGAATIPNIPGLLTQRTKRY